MKKLAITAALVALSSISANAADLGARPYTKAPMMEAAYDWSGFYIGANAGYGWARNEHQDVRSINGFWTDDPGESQTIDPRGAVYGGQIG
jgi:outer membrane immunogenic protein